MNHIAIRSVRVEGLHDQYDVELSFNRELNVIYGKNGRGKTTLLHILANALELDFNRFRHIQFRIIEIVTYEDRSIRITSSMLGNDLPQITVEVDGNQLSPITPGSSLSDAEKALVRDALGARAVYLPAFRAILERTGSEALYDAQRQPELEVIRRSELDIAKADPALSHSYQSHRMSEQHRLTAVKTLQCRQWFGSFVPVVRYPSLVDVKSRLQDEAREATIEMSVFEQSVFSKMFTQVFRAISSSSESPLPNTDDLLDKVQQALSSIDSAYAGASDVYGEIRDAMAEAKNSSYQDTKTAAGILNLYASLLTERSIKHKEIFSKIREFERSVNIFLDDKRLVVNERSSGTRGIFIYSANDRPMNLSALSSGERQVLTMIFCASRLAVDRGIFLVDEPELSLHVDWQRSILGEVVRQAEGRQVIACTHSPEVGADHFESLQMFEPRQTQSLIYDLFADLDAVEEA